MQFALFFAVVLPLSWALMPRRRLWRPFILAASYYFYAAADWHYVLLLAGSTVVNQLAATVITRQSSKKVRRAALITAITLDLGALGVFKYLDFFSESINSSLGLSLGLLHLVLPVGVSFYTFQAISYVVDVHRGRTRLANPLDYAVYASFFPHLVAGPIVRASEFIPQLATPRDPNRVPMARAFGLIAGGLVKKMVIADMIGTKLVDPVFGTPEAHNGTETVMAVYGYAVQIYCDFSAYTDMAIGLALLLGFRFPDNFDRPYTARSLQDFWRRWHMTLSRWLRDYLYIPLGGNRGGNLKTYRNLMLTMLLGGLWHGAAWTFVFWGGIHGIGLAMERAWPSMRKALGFRNGMPVWIPQPVKTTVGRVVTFHVVCLAWVFFRAPDLGTAFAVLGRLFAGGPSTGVVTPTIVLLIAAALAMQWVPRGVGARLRTAFVTLPVYAQGVSLGVLLLVIAAVSGGQGVAPFIYFRF
ncbi:MBOAT family protein [Catenulispora sp. NF23]|uniref:MBOAT family O-acyltransferase n=1 Tax=Catenulispora pinistramenti TaxID=2705254 RepID=UPI001BA7146E|nr:MBOAT family protein [Catenulispora pinistramenti]MBS2534701.1 MBOAT family protein [Catenulispora pinistramenti]